MRKKISTSIEADLWKALRMDALKKGCNVNDILETLIAAYLKKAKKGGR